MSNIRFQLRRGPRWLRRLWIIRVVPMLILEVILAPLVVAYLGIKEFFTGFPNVWDEVKSEWDEE